MKGVRLSNQGNVIAAGVTVGFVISILCLTCAAVVYTTEKVPHLLFCHEDKVAEFSF